MTLHGSMNQDYRRLRYTLAELYTGTSYESNIQQVETPGGTEEPIELCSIVAKTTNNNAKGK